MEYTKTIEKEILLEQLTSLRSLILFNDDVNTFDWVIESLVDTCGHSWEQAEQCSLIVHYKGKCDVKSGTYEELEPICTELLRRGLSAEIN
jgi:ATP-dependent Clp protease adaptor protein ClpS